MRGGCGRLQRRACVACPPEPARSVAGCLDGGHGRCLPAVRCPYLASQPRRCLAPGDGLRASHGGPPRDASGGRSIRRPRALGELWGAGSCSWPGGAPPGRYRPGTDDGAARRYALGPAAESATTHIPCQRWGFLDGLISRCSVSDASWSLSCFWLVSPPLFCPGCLGNLLRKPAVPFPHRRERRLSSTWCPPG